MEQVRDLNMEADDMQVVLSAISGVSKRIKEVAQTHKPLFISQARRCASGCISVPVLCRTIGIGGLFPTHSLQGRYSIRCRIWKGCWRIIISDSSISQTEVL